MSQCETHVLQVPNQTPDKVNPLVEKYIKAEFAKLGSKNVLELETLHGGKPWVADVDHWNYRAASKATEVRCSSFIPVIQLHFTVLQHLHLNADCV